MTPKLSKVWMPLDEFTERTMEGLVRGDPQIAVGFAADGLDKYEKGKLEAVEEAYKKQNQ